jgi:hypothetical protein
LGAPRHRNLPKSTPNNQLIDPKLEPASLHHIPSPHPQNPAPQNPSKTPKPQVQPDLGTIYCVAVPVRRVKPEARTGLAGIDGVELVEWDPEDRESDPSSRFPMGC